MSAGAEGLVERYRDTMGLTREGAIRRMHVLLDCIENDTTTITDLTARLAAVEAENARLREVIDRTALIVERNLYRQQEKVEDVPRILRAALERPAP